LAGEIGVGEAASDQPLDLLLALAMSFLQAPAQGTQNPPGPSDRQQHLKFAAHGRQAAFARRRRRPSQPASRTSTDAARVEGGDVAAGAGAALPPALDGRCETPTGAAVEGLRRSQARRLRNQPGSPRSTSCKRRLPRRHRGRPDPRLGQGCRAPKRCLRLTGEAMPELLTQVRHQRVQQHISSASTLASTLAALRADRRGPPGLSAAPSVAGRGIEAALEQLDRPVAHLIPGEARRAPLALRRGRSWHSAGAVVWFYAGQAGRIQRSARVSAAGSGAPEGGGVSRPGFIKREAGAFQSLLRSGARLHRGGTARCCGRSRGGCPGRRRPPIAHTGRSAGHRRRSARSADSGVDAVGPADLAHLRLFSSRTRAVDHPTIGGRAIHAFSSPGFLNRWLVACQGRPASIVIRATQKKMMSKAGHQQRLGGIPGGQIGGALNRPAQGGEGPEAAGKPGVPSTSGSCSKWSCRPPTRLAAPKLRLALARGLRPRRGPPHKEWRR